MWQCKINDKYQVWDKHPTQLNNEYRGNESGDSDDSGPSGESGDSGEFGDSGEIGDSGTGCGLDVDHRINISGETLL